MFRASSCPLSGATTTAVAASGFTFNLFIPPVLTETILKVGGSHKAQLYCSQLAYVFYWFIGLTTCFDPFIWVIIRSTRCSYVFKSTTKSSWLEHVWTSCRPDDDPNEWVETCCQTNKSIKRRPISYNTDVFCDCPLPSIYFLVSPLERGDSSAVGRGRGGPTTTKSTAITTLQR